MENVAPYSLNGDTNGEFNPASLGVGMHTLTLTPFSQPNLNGTPGAATTITFQVIDNPAVIPVIVTEENSDVAIAFNGATLTRGPFALFTEQNFSSDKRTRVLLFVSDFESGGSNTSVHAENSVLGSVSIPVEHIGLVPGLDWLTQIRVVLPDSLVNAGDVWLRVVSGGFSTNQARISIRQSTVATVMLVEPFSISALLRLHVRRRSGHGVLPRRS